MKKTTQMTCKSLNCKSLTLNALFVMAALLAMLLKQSSAQASDALEDARKIVADHLKDLVVRHGIVMASYKPLADQLKKLEKQIEETAEKLRDLETEKNSFERDFAALMTDIPDAEKHLTVVNANVCKLYEFWQDAKKAMKTHTEVRAAEDAYWKASDLLKEAENALRETRENFTSVRLRLHKDFAMLLERHDLPTLEELLQEKIQEAADKLAATKKELEALQNRRTYLQPQVTEKYECLLQITEQMCKYLTPMEVQKLREEVSGLRKEAKDGLEKVHQSIDGLRNQLVTMTSILATLPLETKEEKQARLDLLAVLQKIAANGDQTKIAEAIESLKDGIKDVVTKKNLRPVYDSSGNVLYYCK